MVSFPRWPRMLSAYIEWGMKRKRSSGADAVSIFKEGRERKRRANSEPMVHNERVREMHTVCRAVEPTFSTAAKDQIGTFATADHIISFAAPDGILLCQEQATRKETEYIYRNSSTRNHTLERLSPSPTPFSPARHPGVFFVRPGLTRLLLNEPQSCVLPSQPRR